MKRSILLLSLLPLLAACGAGAPATQMQTPLTALTAASVDSGLVVTSAVDEPMTAAEVEGRDASGPFELHLVWTAVPRTFLSRLSTVEFNGASILGDHAAVATLRSELEGASRDPRNAALAQAIQDVASELDQAG